MKNQPLALKPHDVCVALQLVLQPIFTYRELAAAVGLSLGESHNSVRRLEVARLFLPHQNEANVPALLEFLVSGVPYVFPGELGPETRGVPTAHSGPALAASIAPVDTIVWPFAEGTVRGFALAPLCAGAPELVHKNPHLYAWLTIVDALRVGRARERGLAREIMERELTSSA